MTRRDFPTSNCDSNTTDEETKHPIPIPTAKTSSQKTESDEDELYCMNSLNMLDHAAELMKRREHSKEQQEKEDEELPLLSPGKRYSASFVTKGYRIPDGYALSYNQDGDVCVENKRKPPFIEGKLHSIRTYCMDGGIPWVYYDHSFKNGEGHTLLKCMIIHGMGGWHDKKRDLRCKVIYLDSDRSFSARKCFVLQIDRPKSRDNILVKGHETNKSVTRIYRSAVPDNVQKAIALRELISIRQGECLASFWHF